MIGSPRSPHGRSPKSLFSDAKLRGNRPPPVYLISVEVHNGSALAFLNQNTHSVQEDLLSTSYTLIETQLELQSAQYTETSNGSPDHLAQEQIVFADTHIAQRITYGDLNDDSFHHDTESTASLANFLSRPVKIHSFSWNLNDPTFVTASIKPWTLYFNHPVILKKVSNFSRLHCSLHIKVIVNATPFYYGSLRLVYQPLPDQRSLLVEDNDLVPLSQLPGFYIEPQSMTTSEITLPFAWPGNWLDLGLGANFDNMGMIDFHQYAMLRSANGSGSTDVTVAVFAWASEVELAGPTYSGVMQSEEYSETSGTISAPATAVANIASKLTDVPYIGPLASATATGARVVSGIAKLFGYSNPPMIDDVHAFQNKTFHAFSNSETRMPIDKLSLDPKNEVSISSSLAGLNEQDPLAFKNLLSKESYIGNTMFSGIYPEETLIWSTYVSPAYRISRTSGGGAYQTLPPMSYVGEMFRFWRGSIIYKFRIIKTQYHKGRLTISWDPNKNIVADADSDSACFTRIVDLETEEEIEVEIPYRGLSPYLKLGNANPYSSLSVPTYPALDKGTYNGCLTVRVQNVLTGPTVTPDINILVYVRAGDDMLYSAPRTINPLLTTFDPAGVIQTTFEPELNVEKSIAQNSVGYDEKVAMITTGENIVSLRPLLHRTSLSTIQQFGTVTSALASGNVTTANLLWRVPVGPGRTPLGYNYDVTDVPYSYATQHPINWVLEMFMGYRGSINVHINPHSENIANVSNISTLSVSRFYDNPIINVNPGDFYRNTFTDSAQVLQTAKLARWTCATFGTTSGYNIARLADGQSGMSLTNPNGQPACSVNLPQYQKNRFFPAFHSARTVDFCTGSTFFDELRVSAIFNFLNAPTAANNNNPYPFFSVYYAAGVDFQPLWFLCTPRVFTVASHPTPKTVT